MIPYKNLGGTAGVIAYAYAQDGIRIRFIDGSEYQYTIESCGKKHIAKMKELAKQGIGLTTYINRHARDCFSEKLK